MPKLLAVSSFITVLLFTNSYTAKAGDVELGDLKPGPHARTKSEPPTEQKGAENPVRRSKSADELQTCERQAKPGVLPNEANTILQNCNKENDREHFLSDINHPEINKKHSYKEQMALSGKFREIQKVKLHAQEELKTKAAALEKGNPAGDALRNYLSVVKNHEEKIEQLQQVLKEAIWTEKPKRNSSVLANEYVNLKSEIRELDKVYQRAVEYLRFLRRPKKQVFSHH